MRNITLTTLLAGALLCLSACNQHTDKYAPNCTPVPNSYQAQQGSFNWQVATPLLVNSLTDTTIIRTALQPFRPEAPLTLMADATTEQQGAICLQRVEHLQLSSGLITPESSSGSRQDNEAYRLEISPKGVTLQATTDAGLFYGLQTLIQLTDPSTGRVQAAIVEDAPRFAYRGIMIDVSRHFRSKAFIKRQIELMARIK